MTGTDLYRRTLAYDCGDSERRHHPRNEGEVKMITEAQQSMTDDLVKRLRAGKDAVYKIGLKYGALEPICGGDIEDAEDLVLSVPLTIALIEAQAAEIARLTKERDKEQLEHTKSLIAAKAKVERLREALKPFAEDWRAFPAFDSNGYPANAKVADFRAARAAYEETGG